jgi:hypothetical protein
MWQSNCRVTCTPQGSGGEHRVRWHAWGNIDQGVTLVVDILREPLLALVEGILVTPTLVRLSPPVRHIVGDLSDRAIVLCALGLEGKAK